MDDALVHERNEQFHSYGLVLILVVMDDALAHRGFFFRINGT